MNDHKNSSRAPAFASRLKISALFCSCISLCFLQSCSEILQDTADLDALVDRIQETDSAFIFLTADWCGGGALTYQNMVVPKVDGLRQNGVPCFNILFGETEKFKALEGKFEGLDEVDGDEFFTVEKFTHDSPPFHKLKMNALCKSLDPNWTSTSTVPIIVMYRNGALTPLDRTWLVD